MARTLPGDGKVPQRGPASAYGTSTSRILAACVRYVRDHLRPTTYVDCADAPDPPPSPYRARLTVRSEGPSEAPELEGREVVRGKIRTYYSIRCACGKRWFNDRFESIQVCPRCGCAVLLQPDS